MYSVIDKLYGGLDVQAGSLLNIILETVGPLKGFHFPSENRVSMYGQKTNVFFCPLINRVA